MNLSDIVTPEDIEKAFFVSDSDREKFVAEQKDRLTPIIDAMTSDLEPSLRLLVGVSLCILDAAIQISTRGRKQ